MLGIITDDLMGEGLHSRDIGEAMAVRGHVLVTRGEGPFRVVFPGEVFEVCTLKILGRIRGLPGVRSHILDILQWVGDLEVMPWAWGYVVTLVVLC